MDTIQTLLLELQFRMIDGKSAYGEVDGCPVKLVLLGYQPLSLLIGFYVGTEHQQTQVALSPESLPSVEKTELSLDDGIIWLSLFNLHETSGAAIADALRRIVAELKQTGFNITTNCVKCGAPETTVTLQGDQPYRICLNCLEAEQQKFAELNRPRLSTLYWLPFGIVMAAVGWATVWLVIDLYIDWLRGVGPGAAVPLSKITLLPILGFAAVIFGVGGGMGRAIPSAGMSRDFAITLSIVISLAAISIGELLYIACTIFKQFGVFDVLLAFQVLIPWLQGYHSLWVGLKIIFAASLFGGCFMQARTRIYRP